MPDDSSAELTEKPGIEIGSVGVQWFHPSGFVIDRPNGREDYLFLQWLTPTILKINGQTFEEPSGGCILYRPGDPQWYGGDIFSPFGNNWFHFQGPLVPVLFEECQLPICRPLHLRDDSFIEPTLRFFLRESMTERLGWKHLLSANASMFLIELARAIRSDSAKRKSARNMELLEKFEAFRDQLKERCAEPWTLGRMAGELHLSQSRFSNLYREFFDAKPVDDLIHMRINLAEYYLRTTSMPISYVANLCGFTDTYYFSRLFKAKTGKTASSFRTIHQT